MKSLIAFVSIFFINCLALADSPVITESSVHLKSINIFAQNVKAVEVIVQQKYDSGCGSGDIETSSFKVDDKALLGRNAFILSARLMILEQGCGPSKEETATSKPLVFPAFEGRAVVYITLLIPEEFEISVREIR